MKLLWGSKGSVTYNRAARGGICGLCFPLTEHLIKFYIYI
jgi:hypothetical protein